MIDAVATPKGLRARAEILREKNMINDGGSTAQHLELAADALERPIDMILFCPNCGKQHIDAPTQCSLGVGCPESGVCYAAAHDQPEQCDAWDNPPHRSHLCHGCKHVWRPADVPTNGVDEIATVGRNDSPEKVRGQIALRLTLRREPYV